MKIKTSLILVSIVIVGVVLLCSKIKKQNIDKQKKIYEQTERFEKL